ESPDGGGAAIANREQAAARAVGGRGGDQAAAHGAAAHIRDPPASHPIPPRRSGPAAGCANRACCREQKSAWAVDATARAAGGRAADPDVGVVRCNEHRSSTGSS